MPIQKKKYANHITAGKRRKIYKLFYGKNKTITQIAEEEAVTYWQVYRIVNGEVKLDGSPRIDKGKKRGSAAKPKSAHWNLDDFVDLDDFQLFLLMDTLEDLASYKLDPQEKINIVKSIETIQTKIQQRQLQNSVRRPEAEVIARIIRRFRPDATNQEVVRIYEEEFELYMKERK